MIKRIIVLLFLFSQVVYGADFLDDVHDMTLMVYQNLSLKTINDKVDSTIIQKHIKSAFAFLVSTGAREWQDTVVTVKYQMDYVLDSQLIQVYDVYWHHMDSIKGMNKITTGQLDTLRGIRRSLIGEKGFLARSDYFRWVNGRITLIPPPVIANDTIIIIGIAKIEDIDTGTTFPAEILVTYRPLIVSYATALTAASLNDMDRAQWWYGIFKDQAAILDITIGSGVKNNDK